MSKEKTGDDLEFLDSNKKTLEEKIDDIHYEVTYNPFKNWNWDWNVFFKWVGIVTMFVCLFVGLGRVVFAFTTQQQDFLDAECVSRNYTFSQCQLYQSLQVDEISDETDLIEQTKEDLQDEFNDKLDDFKDDIDDNFTLLYNNLENLDFSSYNDSERIEKLSDNIDDKFYEQERKIKRLEIRLDDLEYGNGTITKTQQTTTSSSFNFQMPTAQDITEARIMGEAWDIQKCALSGDCTSTTTTKKETSTDTNDNTEYVKASAMINYLKKSEHSHVSIYVWLSLMTFIGMITIGLTVWGILERAELKKENKALHDIVKSIQKK